MESDDLTGSILLLDIYGGLLTTRQRELIVASGGGPPLGEIAAMEGISRQGVRDSIVKGMRIMNNAEQQLGLLDKELRLRALLNLMKRMPRPPHTPPKWKKYSSSRGPTSFSLTARRIKVFIRVFL